MKPVRAMMWIVLACSAAAALGQEPQPTESDSRLGDAAGRAQEIAGQVAERVDQSERAAEVSAGILNPIYRLAEWFSFAAFHWVAFALMVTGVVSFGGQLVLGKLVVLSRFSFSPMEILSDAASFLACLIGLFLTTQAAAENSTFTQSPAAVLSATAVGAVAGLVFYLHGQSQELRAARKRSRDD